MVLPLTAILPTDKDLPDSDGVPVDNLADHPQAILLTDSIRPHLLRVRPDGLFATAHNSGIYWRITDPPLDGCKAPDWFCVLGVSQSNPDGTARRSYVMWQEIRAPVVVIEFVSGDGSEEHDQTPDTGKFWVYEQAIRAPYYAILDGWRGTLEVYRLNGGHYDLLTANERGHYPIPPLEVELGLWNEWYMNTSPPWLRWYDMEGKLLPTGHELAEQERQRAEQERQRAEQERQRAEQAEQELERLRERLRAKGLNGD